MKAFTFTDVYHAHYTIIYAPITDWSKIAKKHMPLWAYNGMKWDSESRGRCAVQWLDGFDPDNAHCSVAIFIDSRNSPRRRLSTIVHESAHASFAVLEQAGLKLCDQSEEAFTYHLDWLVEQIEEGIKR